MKITLKEWASRNYSGTEDEPPMFTPYEWVPLNPNPPVRRR